MQKLFQGAGSLSQLVKAIAGEGNRELFLITGRHFLQEGGLRFLEGLNYVHFIKSGANVHDHEVEEAWKAYRDSNAKAVLAIGGGSVIDLAKMIRWNAVQQKKELPVLAAAPTTTGSGSEATQFAVLYENNKKRSISHPALLPALVALDPELVCSLSPYQAAVSGMDALAQAVESYWSRAATTGSREYAAKAIELWNGHFIPSLEKTNRGSREMMQLAAYHAGQAINHTRTTGPHALSYYLTAEHGVPHGQAVALFLPAFFLYNHPPADLYKQLGVNSNAEAASLIKKRMKEAGLVTGLSELGIDKEKIMDKLMAEVNEERFGNNPVAFDRDQLKQLITAQL